MSAMDYAKQKTFEALLSLVGDGPIRRRLASAGLPLVILSGPTNDGLTPSASACLQDILDELTEKHTVDVDQGAAALSDEDAVRLAKNILSLHIEVMGGI